VYAPCIYETDLNLWYEETMNKFKERNFESLDIENLIEEIVALASRDYTSL
jgi:Domain of unknown function DUF29.